MENAFKASNGKIKVLVVDSQYSSRMHLIALTVIKLPVFKQEAPKTYFQPWNTASNTISIKPAEAEYLRVDKSFRAMGLKG